MAHRKFHQYKRFYLLLLIALYLLFGFFYVPRLIEDNVKAQLDAQLGMHTAMTEVHFNPLTFNTEFTGLSLTDQNQNNWFKAQTLGLNFNPSKLLWGQWHFSDLTLSQPEVHISTDVAGNLTVPSLPELESATESAEPLDLMIEGIQLNQGKFDVLASHINEDFSLNVKTLAIEHDALRLDDSDTQFTINLMTHDDEGLDVDGSYNHAQQKIEATFNFKAWQSATLDRALPKELAVSNPTGHLSGQGQLDWLLNGVPQLNIDQLQVNEWSTQWREINLEGLNATLSGINIDPLAQSIQIQNIQSDQANWSLLLPLSNVPESDVEDNEISTKERGWDIGVASIQIQNWPIAYQDEVGQMPLMLESLQIDQFNASELSATTQASITVAKSGALELTGQLDWVAGNNQFNWQINDLDLTPLSPWIHDNSGLVVSAGQLSTQQATLLDHSGFDTQGQITVNQLQTENAEGQPVAAFKQVAIGNSRIDSHSQTITIDDITLEEAVGSLIVDANKNLNIQGLAAEDNHANDAETADNSVADDTTSPWVIQIGEINLKDVSTSLIDHSVQPSVTTEISELNGQIKGLSSEALSKADVAINGKFNRFSPVSIQGQINPLSSTAYTDIEIKIDDLDLLPYSPYSQSFLAFPVQGGKLNLAVKYNLNQFELQGDNKLLFKQLKFGNKVNVPDAIDLPLKLAVSLLTDGNGEMQIDLPVAGNINDPTFSYGGLIGKAIFKLITNIVASPFKLLGKLIPNPDPNLSDIMFEAGSADLLESEQNKLNQIAEILGKKPELKLQLNPHNNASFDESALKTQLLLIQAPFDALDLSDAKVQEWLEARLSAEALTAHQNTDPETGTVSTDHQAIWDDLVAQQAVDQAALNQLTSDRNLAIKNYLIEQASIASENIFIEQAQNTDQVHAMVKVGVTR